VQRIRDPPAIPPEALPSTTCKDMQGHACTDTSMIRSPTASTRSATACLYVFPTNGRPLTSPLFGHVSPISSWPVPLPARGLRGDGGGVRGPRCPAWALKGDWLLACCPALIQVHFHRGPNNGTLSGLPALQLDLPAVLPATPSHASRRFKQCPARRGAFARRRQSLVG
jgi:hypothetical protein